jgi:hypothetical protein
MTGNGAFDTSTPNIARVYDHLLGGKDNYAADRELATELERWWSATAGRCSPPGTG